MRRYDTLKCCYYILYYFAQYIDLTVMISWTNNLPTPLTTCHPVITSNNKTDIHWYCNIKSICYRNYVNTITTIPQIAVKKLPIT